MFFPRTYLPSRKTFDLVVNADVVELLVENVRLARQRHYEAVQPIVVILAKGQMGITRGGRNAVDGHDDEENPPHRCSSRD